MKPTLTLVTSLLLSITLPNPSHCQYAIEWSKTYQEGFDTNVPWMAKQTSDGGTIVIGRVLKYSVDIEADPADCWVMKLDKANEVEWSRRYGGSEYDWGLDVVEDGGSFVVNARTQSNDGDVKLEEEFVGYGYNSWVFKLDRQGDILWQRGYGEAGCAGPLRAEGGTVLVAGNTDIGWWLKKLGPDGDELWSEAYGSAESKENVSWLRSGNGGDFYAVGFSSSTEIWARKLDANGKSLLRKNAYKPADRGIGDVCMTQDGNPVYVGVSSLVNPDFDLTDEDVIVGSFSLEGNGALPSGVYGGTDYDSGSNILPISTDRYLVSANIESNDGDISNHYDGFDWWLFVIDRAGKILWEKNFGGSYSELLYSMQPTADGGFILAGTSTSIDHDLNEASVRKRAWLVKLMPVNTTGQCDPPLVYPNPVRVGDVLNLEMEQGFGPESRLEVFEVSTGRRILHLLPAELEDRRRIRLPDDMLPASGMYAIRVSCGEESHVVKLLKLR